jgi:hypothetical protein
MHFGVKFSKSSASAANFPCMWENMPLCPDNDEGAGRVWEGWRRFLLAADDVSGAHFPLLVLVTGYARGEGHSLTALELRRQPPPPTLGLSIGERRHTDLQTPSGARGG